MSKRELKLRDYQEAPIEAIRNTKRIVLASAPGSGKTEMSIFAIEEYLKVNPKSRVLVIAHDTNILLLNYTHRLNDINVSFTYSTDLTSNAQVHITIPQNSHKIEGEYDLLVVDEAHENYLAPRMQTLLEQIKPTKEILLTGTPSKFIREGGYEIYTIALNKLPEENVSKINIELVASEYNWYGNYNDDQNVKKDFEITVQDTKQTLENILPTLLNRTKVKTSAKRFNFPNLLSKAKSWAFTFKSIGKTMIVCNTIEQADIVYEILEEENVKQCISHSKNDRDSQVIDNFISDDNNVLVVVDRGRLGYNNTELINIIDLSGTHNPDLIYQMLCRISRPSKNKDVKYFIKVTPKNKINMELTHMAVCAGLMLTDEEYISKYDGQNFNQISIPVLKPNRSESSGNKRSYKDNKVVNLPTFKEDVINLFKNIILNMDKPVGIYESTTIGHVRYKLGELKNLPERSILDIYRSAAGKKASILDIKNFIDEDNVVIEENAGESSYTSLQDWRRKDIGAYKSAVKKKITKDIATYFGWTYRENKPAGFWTADKVLTEALKHKTIKGWKEKSMDSYRAAQRLKIYDEATAHIPRLIKVDPNRKPANYWTEKRILADSSKYKTPSEWKKGSESAVRASRRLNIYDKATEHMEKKTGISWTPEKIIEEAKKFQTKKEWRKEGYNSYKASFKHNCYDEASKHMK